MDFLIDLDSLNVLLTLLFCGICETEIGFWCTGFPGNPENRWGVVPDLVRVGDNFPCIVEYGKTGRIRLTTLTKEFVLIIALSLTKIKHSK